MSIRELAVFCEDRARAARWARRFEDPCVAIVVAMIIAKVFWPAWLPCWGVVTMPLWGPVAVLIGLPIAWRLMRALLRVALRG